MRETGATSKINQTHKLGVSTIKFQHLDISNLSKNQTVLYTVCVLIILLAGVWGAGTFLGAGPLDEGNGISGTVYNANGEPVPAVAVEAVSESGRTIQTTTAADGTYLFRRVDPGETYTIAVVNTTEDYNLYRAIPPATDINFGEPANQGLLSNLPIIGERDSSTTKEDNDSTDTEATKVDESTDNSRSTSDDEESTTDNRGTQTIDYVEGKVVNQDDEPIGFVNITVLDQEGNELANIQDESNINTGEYRIEDIPFEGDLENGELILKAEKEGQIETTTINIDLTIYSSPEDGITSGTHIVVAET